MNNVIFVALFFIMLVIERGSGYADKIRAYSVVLDDDQIGSVGDGQTMEFELKPGTHTLYLKIDWARSNKVTFEASGNKTIRFKCGSNLRGAKVFLGVIYVFFLFNRYIKLDQIV